MDLSLSPEQTAFRDEVRAWLHENVPRPPLPSPGTAEGFAAHREWERKLSAAGYGGIAWPRSYGGRGADVVMQAIFEEEYLAAGAPERVTILGQKLMAPTLMAHGTEEQKDRWLPGILSATDIWSQGFSEPGAGSDLAAIRTRGTVTGDELVINGQKIWTSYGAFADWIFILARTDPRAERHAGISFIVVDMSTPGVEARPITQLDGHAGFAEVFFTDARVPLSNVVGDINEGWRVAMTTLGAERNSPPRSATRYLRDLDVLLGICRRRGITDDPLVGDSLARLYVEARCYALAALHAVSRIARGQDLGADASVMKLLWSELERRVYETGLELLGPLGASVDEPGPDFWHNYWYARAATIYAGTSEIQRNIVAERVLGLPREPRAEVSGASRS
jgi:alkylation response protein AidB-like acyl-CoA dehydrogenase